MTNTLERVGLVILVVVVGYGLTTAFYGLGVSSFWHDELFTTFVIGTDHSWAGVFARALQDGHPPVFSLAIFAYSELFGVSEVSLRAFSALLATASLILFVRITRDVFSLQARLFATGVATASYFWFYQSQNARSYSLGLFVGVLILWAAISLIRKPILEIRWFYTPWFRLTLFTFVGISIRYYMLFVALAVLAILFIFESRLRIKIMSLGIALLVVTYCYLKFVVHPNSIFLLDTSWVESNTRWYKTQTDWAIHTTVSNTKVLGAFLSIIFFVSWLSKDRLNLSRIALKTGLLCMAVPILVVVAGISSSVLMSPNYTDRNVLLASPFLWGTVAFLYDLALGGIVKYRQATLILTAGFVAFMLSIAPSRAMPRNTPFRESAAAINAIAGCRGKSIPVFLGDRSHITPAGIKILGNGIYGHYLDRSIQPDPVFIEEVLSGRVKPVSTCRIVAWGAHFINSESIAHQLASRLAAVQRTPISIEEFRPPSDTLGGWKTAYLFVANRDMQGRAANERSSQSVQQPR